MNSMTGFGRAELTCKPGRFIVEISSVNNRFLEMSVRLPRPLSALEPAVREELNSAVSRGKLSVFVNLTPPDTVAEKAYINKAAAKAYLKQLRDLQKELKISGNIEVRDLLLLPEIAIPEKAEPDLELIGGFLHKTLGKALKDFLGMRAREGKAMAADMRKSLKEMAGLLTQVEAKTAGAVQHYKNKLTNRIEELLDKSMRDSLRLEEEIAVFAERTDINEECVRFHSHIEQFTATLSEKNAVGRRLNFLLQEMNREANTIGSKSADFDISTIVISIKEEIEKLREQVQNVE